MAAARNWEVAWEQAGKAGRSKCGTYLLIVTKRYVDAANERMREERTRMGTGSVKNPSSDKIKERLGWMGTDHEEFSGDIWAKSVGLETGALDDESNFMARSSAPSSKAATDAADAEEEEARLKAEKKDEAKGAKRTKK